MTVSRKHNQDGRCLSRLIEKYEIKNRESFQIILGLIIHDYDLIV